MKSSQGLTTPYTFLPKTFSQIQLAYAASAVGPHADTQRATYTVPAGKKAMLTAACVLMVKVTVSTAVGIAKAYVKYTPSGGTAGTLAQVAFHALAVSQVAVYSEAYHHVLVAGDQIEIRTADLATGGANTYDTYATLLEFNA